VSFSDVDVQVTACGRATPCDGIVRSWGDDPGGTPFSLGDWSDVLPGRHGTSGEWPPEKGAKNKHHGMLRSVRQVTLWADRAIYREADCQVLPERAYAGEPNSVTWCSKDSLFEAPHTYFSPEVSSRAGEFL
jgi:hypothetical protein